MNKSVEVRVLYTTRCSSVAPTIDLLERVGNDMRVAVTLEKVLVASKEEAVNLRCLGSPTVQINGLDIDPEAREKTKFHHG